MKRYELLKELAALVTTEDVVVTSIGGVKPEWYSLMPGNGTMFADLLGCATAFALGMALSLPHRRVVALDTDGGVLFNLGGPLYSRERVAAEPNDYRSRQRAL